jgi:hypothetical protein
MSEQKIGRHPQTDKNVQNGEEKERKWSKCENKKRTIFSERLRVHVG